jgi:hypothetical protein
MTAAVSEAVSIPVVASGGAGKPEHLADAVLVGKADAAGCQHFSLRRVHDPGDETGDGWAGHLRCGCEHQEFGGGWMNDVAT